VKLPTQTLLQEILQHKHRFVDCIRFILENWLGMDMKLLGPFWLVFKKQNL